MCICESEQKDVHVSTVSTPMTKTVQQQAAHETLSPVTCAGKVQGNATFYTLPAAEYHGEMKGNH